MDEIIKINLKIFFQENENILDLIIPFEKWEIAKENEILFLSNNKIKGQIVFTPKFTQVTKIHRITGSFTGLGMKSIIDITNEGCLYTDDLPAYYNYDASKHGIFIKNNIVKITHMFPADKKGRELYQNLIKIKSKIKKEHIKNYEGKMDELYSQIMSLKNEFINEHDKDGNGIIDVIEGHDDFMKLLTKYQIKIKEIDSNHIKNFIKVSNHLRTKRENIQTLFTKIKSSNPKDDNLTDMMGILENSIHSYELTLFNSFQMINTLIDDDLVTFYQIYETFDKINLFNSNWQNELNEKLKNIENKLDDIFYSIQSMEMTFIEEFKKMSYTTQKSIGALNKSLSTKLESINSGININNVLSGVQIYQLYKINKQTKGLIE
tara:strand:- start:601 stop:1734 length:1134 start_codon:yes stop_codon:yes gene_type:complete